MVPLVLPVGFVMCLVEEAVEVAINAVDKVEEGAVVAEVSSGVGSPGEVEEEAPALLPSSLALIRANRSFLFPFLSSSRLIAMLTS